MGLPRSIRLVRFLPLLSIVVLLAGCPPRSTVKKKKGSPGSETDTAGARAGDGATLDEGTDTGELPIRGGTSFAEIPDLVTIQFDYDAYALGREARETLRTNAEYLKSHPDFENQQNEEMLI